MSKESIIPVTKVYASRKHAEIYKYMYTRVQTSIH